MTIWPDLRLQRNGRTAILQHDVIRVVRRAWIARRGTVSDGASIPRLLWPFIGGPFEGRHRNAAILHDAAYRRWARESTFWPALTSSKRAVCDRMLYEIAAMDGTSPCVAFLVYAGVRLGGWYAWMQHAKRRNVVRFPA